MVCHIVGQCFVMCFFMFLVIPIDVFEGITDEGVAKVVDGLYKLFVDCDYTILIAIVLVILLIILVSCTF